MSGRATVIGSLTQEPSRVDLTAFAETVDLLEVRVDRTGPVDTEELRKSFPGKLLFTLRSRAEGGRGPDDGQERVARIMEAAERFDMIDLEAERDLLPEILERVPAERRIISWHGGKADLDTLQDQFSRMVRQAARWYKMVCFAEQPRECIFPLLFARTLDRKDVIIFAAGEIATWTRLLAPRLGAPVVYGAVGSRRAAPGQPTVEVLCRDYGLPGLPPVRRLFGLVGHPAGHSLSPRMHNGMYHALGLEHLYLAFDMPVFGDFWLDIVEGSPLQDLGFPLAGLSVTAPFKEVALAVAGASSPLAERIGSANTLLRRASVWEAETTDSDGVRGPLAEIGIEIEGKRAAVLGAGGAGRAAAFGLGLGGADITLVNRGVERGRRVAQGLGVPFTAFDDFNAGEFDIIANATPLGANAEGELPFDLAALRQGAVVVDMAYLQDRPTRLVEEARRLGRVAIDGREVLLHQAVPQFRAMNDVSMAVDIARRILELGPSPMINESGIADE